MTDAPDPKTIDFAQVFAGRSYPKDSVPVIVDEELGYRAHKLQQAIREADLLGDSVTATGLQATFDTLVTEALPEVTYTFHLTGVSREDRTAITEKIQAEYEIETDVFGRMKPNPEADKAYKALRWALHIERIEGPEGSVAVAPTPENLAAFLASAPDRAIADVDEKIVELSGEGATDGFDALIRNADFLSQR